MSTIGGEQNNSSDYHLDNPSVKSMDCSADSLPISRPDGRKDNLLGGYGYPPKITYQIPLPQPRMLVRINNKNTCFPVDNCDDNRKNLFGAKFIDQTFRN